MIDSNINKEIKYSDKENEFYNHLYNITKKPNNDFIEGGEVVGLFLKANLQKVIKVKY